MDPDVCGNCNPGYYADGAYCRGNVVKFNSSYNHVVCNRRIYHECEGWTKTVPPIAVWHYRACRMMTNSNQEQKLFLSNPHTINVFFFLLTIKIFHIVIATKQPTS